MREHIDELRAALRRARRLVRDLERINRAYDGESDDDEIDVNADDEDER